LRGRWSLKYALAFAVILSLLAGAETFFTSFDVWKEEGATGSDSKQLVIVDGDIIVAGGI
jgi:hypothetical protein